MTTMTSGRGSGCVEAFKDVSGKGREKEASLSLTLKTVNLALPQNYDTGARLSFTVRPEKPDGQIPGEPLRNRKLPKDVVPLSHSPNVSSSDYRLRISPVKGQSNYWNGTCLHIRGSPSPPPPSRLSGLVSAEQGKHQRRGSRDTNTDGCVGGSGKKSIDSPQLQIGEQAGVGVGAREPFTTDRPAAARIYSSSPFVIVVRRQSNRECKK